MIKRTGPVKSLLSILLTVSILFGITPLSAVSVPVVPETENTRQSPTEEFKAPDIIDAEEQAEKSYVGRVKEDEKDLYTFVFRNEDGSNTMRVFDHPVKYVDDKGETRDISLEISKDKDGSFKAADHMIKASFGDDISEGIGLEYDGVRIGMTARSENSGKAKAGLSDDGKKLTYAVDGKTSYVYSLTYCGIKEDIVVSEYTGQTEYEFTLNTNGLHPVKIDDSVFLADNDEEIKASIGDIIIFTADNRNNAFGDLQFEAVEENSEYKFTIVLDPDYLRDEKTVYPITIDPTIEISYDNNGAGAIEDVTINSLDTSAGSSGSLYVGRRNTYGLSRILMRFPNLDLTVIATANDITSATVEMKDLLCETESMTVYCYLFNGNSWSESNVDWQTVSPNSCTTFLSSRAVSYSVGNSLNPLHRYSFSILSAVKGWKNGTADQSKGIIFKAPYSVETGSTYIHKTFASYNRASNKPSVEIKYKINEYYSNYTYNGSSQLYSNHSDYYRNTPGIDDGLRYRANCYGYAYRLFCGDFHVYRQMPGEFADKSNGFVVYDQINYIFSTLTSYYEMTDLYAVLIPSLDNPPQATYAEINDNVERMHIFSQLLAGDMYTLGYTMTEYTNNTLPDAETLDGARLVAVVISENDFHFYIQHSDNTWSHKRGMTAPQNTCIESSHNVVLTNDTIRDHACEGDYAGGVLKFFLINKTANIDYCHEDGRSYDSAYTRIKSTDHAGNDICTAQSLGMIPTTTATGHIGYVGDIDYYVFSVDSYSLYTISISCLINDFTYTVELFDTDGHMMLMRTDTNGTVCPWYLAKGDYFIKIYKTDQLITSESQNYKYSINIH